MDYKRIVHDRDGVCQFCKTKGSKGNPLTVHHIIPRCKNGSNTPENCILLCQDCHRHLHKSEGYPTGKYKSHKKKKKRRR